ncbi:MAG: hypothetical protein COB76_00830 [Alphaproteobacteria bacterium]|nr:MAG: hypothetical protein COB76_00830 [Alphaproteobacteria bacterium]
MKILSFFICSLFLLSACETRPLNTSQSMTIDIVGADEAYCILSTKYNRYQVYAPDTLKIERSIEDLKVDCTGSASRRRVLTLEPTFDQLYYRYPEHVTVDFSTMNNGNRYNGYRAEPSQFDTMVKEVVTEDSFSAPVETKQTYPVPRTYTMGRKSYPVSLD